jgi:hypothetical protein
MEQGSGVGVARALARHAPTVVLRPAVGATKALSNALLGVGNALDEGSRRKIEDVSLLNHSVVLMEVSANVGRNISRIRRGCVRGRRPEGEEMYALDCVAFAGVFFFFWGGFGSWWDCLHSDGAAQGGITGVVFFTPLFTYLPSYSRVRGPGVRMYLPRYVFSCLLSECGEGLSKRNFKSKCIRSAHV